MISAEKAKELSSLEYTLEEKIELAARSGWNKVEYTVPNKEGLSKEEYLSEVETMAKEIRKHGFIVSVCNCDDYIYSGKNKVTITQKYILEIYW